jgi:hypothetical protein
MGPGLHRQEAVGGLVERVWNSSDLFLGSKPSPLAGYPDQL